MDDPTEHQPELTEQAERASWRHDMAVEALHRAREAHLRAIDMHERAAALFDRSGETEWATAERQAVEREWGRLKEAEQLIAENETDPVPPGEPGPGGPP